MKLDLNSQVVDKARAAYAGLAIGDALGCTVEFMTPREIQLKHGVHSNITGGGWLHLKAGQVTDDTEMSLALGNALIRKNAVDASSIGQAFSDWMRSKPVDIGNTVRRGILHFRNTGETSVAHSEFNAGNGACMRTLPIALVTLGCDDEYVRSASRLQAHITHHSELSDAGTEHIIELVQMSITGSKFTELSKRSKKFISKYRQFDFNRREALNPGGYIVETLQAVLQGFYNTDSFESCLVDVVNRGGDADTTGAIAGMIAGAYYGYDSIPERWLRQLAKNILQSCIEQAEALTKLAPIKINNNPVHNESPQLARLSQ